MINVQLTLTARQLELLETIAGINASVPATVIRKSAMLAKERETHGRTVTKKTQTAELQDALYQITEAAYQARQNLKGTSATRS